MVTQLVKWQGQDGNAEPFTPDMLPCALLFLSRSEYAEILCFGGILESRVGGVRGVLESLLG